MITQFSNALKDSGKLSLTATVIFFGGMLISTYLLFTLPHNLTMEGGLPTLAMAWPVLINLFIAIGLTFITGIATIHITLQARKEIVVYLEKKNEDATLAAQREEETTGELKDIAAFKATLQQAKEEKEILQLGLNTLCQQLQAGQGAIYQSRTREGKTMLELAFGFALPIGENSTLHFEQGEGLIGQAAASGTTLYLDEVPEGYISIVSGLGTASPRYLMIIPIRKGQEIKGVVEIATFSPLQESQRKQVEDRVHILAENIN